MDTRQIISTATEVTTISRITSGDVYKRTVTSYDGTTTLRFGVVLDAMNNGVDSAITAVEYRPADFGASTITIETKVFTGGELALFPATAEEVRQHLMDLTSVAEKGVSSAQASLAKAEETLAEVQRLAARLGGIRTPETTSEPAQPLPSEDDDTEALDPSVLDPGF